MALNPPQSTIEREQSALKTRGRLEYIEGLRGLAALYVVLQHVCTLSDPYSKMARPGAEPRWLAWVMAPLWYGHLAVAAFIVLSGFCLQLSLYGRSNGRLTDRREFFRRRCRRILPPYYACLAFSLIVVWLVTSRQKGMPWAQYVPVTWENVMAHVFMIHNLRPEWMYKINGVLWSIAIEFQLYLFFPLLVGLLINRGRLALLGTVAGVVAVPLIFVAGSHKLYLWYAPLFALGMVAAHIGLHPRRRRPAPGWVALTGLTFGALCVLSIGWTKSLWIRDSLGGLAISALLVLGLLTPRGLAIRFLSLRWIVIAGTISYSLYLFHHPILQIVEAARPEGVASDVARFAFLLAIGVPIALVGSAGFFWLFERPFLSRKMRPDHERRAPAQAPEPGRNLPRRRGNR